MESRPAPLGRSNLASGAEHVPHLEEVAAGPAERTPEDVLARVCVAVCSPDCGLGGALFT